MTKKDSPKAQVTILRTVHASGIPLYRVQVYDQFAHQKYRVQRRLVRTLHGFMEDFLRRHPEMEFDHAFNFTRIITYLPSGLRAWSNYMPGGIATYHVHTPQKRPLPTGQKLDLITKNFFHHSVDAVGLRSRAKILEYLAHQYINGSEGEIRWLSIAGGSGQPVYDACMSVASERSRMHLTLVDIDESMIRFAKKIYTEEEVNLASAEFRRMDILKAAQRSAVLKEVRPQIIDCMGLFEYLDNEKAVSVLRSLYEALPSGGRIIFTNMSPGHPHLHVHKRALGWPGVIQRTIHAVVGLLEEAGIPLAESSVYRAEDNVYNVYMVEKI